MNLLHQISNMLHQFETLIFKGAQMQTAQHGTMELFFGTVANQNQFNSIIQNAKSAPGKVLTSHWSHKNEPASFKLSMSAEPGKGARWILQVSPPSLTASVAAGLNAEYAKLMHQTMPERMKAADKQAKVGAGSGTLEVGSLEVS